MNSFEKAEMLKDTIYTLYSKEGRSISYISGLLYINRKTLSLKIREWDLPEAEPRHHLNPSTQKFINKNRELIISRLNNDIPATEIARELKIGRDRLNKVIIANDEKLREAAKQHADRRQERSDQRRQDAIDASKREYQYEPIDGEEWKTILGYPDYEVSNMGRVRRYARRNSAFYLLHQQPNKNNSRLYVRLSGEKDRNLQVANLVAHAFVPGYDEIHCTVNHEDGDVQNNKASNLSWMTQSENNYHAYEELNRTRNRGKRYKFSKIRYKGKYEFKTVSALARFLGKSETQTRRYLDRPEEHDLELIG